MVKREFTAVFQKKGKWIAAWLEEVPGVNTQGRTMKEVKENLRDALLLILEEGRKVSALKNYTAHKEVLRIAIPA